MSDSNKINRKYLENKVNPILELMIASLMKHRPENALEFMENWLEKKGTDI